MRLTVNMANDEVVLRMTVNEAEGFQYVCANYQCYADEYATPGEEMMKALDNAFGSALKQANFEYDGGHESEDVDAEFHIE